MQALADATGVPVDVVAVPEGGALGRPGWPGRPRGSSRPGPTPGGWARTDHRVEPDPGWATHVADRYARYRELAG